MIESNSTPLFNSQCFFTNIYNQSLGNFLYRFGYYIKNIMDSTSYSKNKIFYYKNIQLSYSYILNLLLKNCCCYYS